MFIIEVVLCILAAMAIMVFWNVLVLKRPFKTKKYYELPILEIKGEVVNCVYFIWADRWSMHSYYITIRDLKSQEYRSITAEITPLKNFDKHKALVSTKRGDKGTLYYRKGKHANYFEDFVQDVEFAEEKHIYLFDCSEELDLFCDREDITPKQKSVSRKIKKQIKRRQKRKAKRKSFQ